jgi:hypothetical protein
LHWLAIAVGNVPDATATARRNTLGVRRLADDAGPGQNASLYPGERTHGHGRGHATTAQPRLLRARPDEATTSASAPSFTRSRGVLCFCSGWPRRHAAACGLVACANFLGLDGLRRQKRRGFGVD